MKQIMYAIAVGYVLCLSVVGFAAMGLDKRRAVKGKWRISEKSLLLIAFLGGGIGSFLGMRHYRHKTKHLSFRLLLPILAFADLLLLYYLISLLY
jgi:uncharacterized membrane protein YsdA (DUF1294 family)